MPARVIGERIAVLSDVHGNLTAFDAVLADIEARGITTVVNLGDTVGKGPRGSACIARSRARCAIAVQGNWDEWMGAEQLREPRGMDTEGLRAIRWWHGELSAADRDWLRGLPFAAAVSLGGADVRLVHASTTSVWTRVRRQHTAEEAAGFFAPSPLIAPGLAPSVVCYGDLHHAYLERLPQGLLVNVGSVGNPLDATRACYAVLEVDEDGARATLIRVEYDVEAELAAASTTDMPQFAAWARELREAYYRGRTD